MPDTVCGDGRAAFASPSAEPRVDARAGEEAPNAAMIGAMDATKIDQEFEQLQAEFQDVAKTVQSLAAKMQAAAKAGDANASEWLGDLKQVAQDVDDEQTQVKALLVAIHGFVGDLAQNNQAAPSQASAETPAASASDPQEGQAAQ